MPCTWDEATQAVRCALFCWQGAPAQDRLPQPTLQRLWDAVGGVGEVPGTPRGLADAPVIERAVALNGWCLSASRSVAALVTAESDADFQILTSQRSERRQKGNEKVAPRVTHYWLEVDGTSVDPTWEQRLILGDLGDSTPAVFSYAERFAKYRAPTAKGYMVMGIQDVLLLESASALAGVSVKVVQR